MNDVPNGSQILDGEFEYFEEVDEYLDVPDEIEIFLKEPGNVILQSHVYCVHLRTNIKVLLGHLDHAGIWHESEFRPDKESGLVFSEGQLIRWLNNPNEFEVIANESDPIGEQTCGRSQNSCERRGSSLAHDRPTDTPRPKEPSKKSPRETPLAEQSMDSFDYFFRTQRGLHCLLHAKDEEGSEFIISQPDPITALQLIPACVAGEEYIRTTGCDVPKRNEVLKGIKQRVAEMARRGYEYTFIWNLAGDQSVHVDPSRDFDYECRRDLYDAVRMDLKDFLCV